MDADTTSARGWLRSTLLTAPIALWSLVMFMPTFMHTDLGRRTIDFQDHPRVIAVAITIAFMVGLFLMMMRTGQTYRWRRYFFVALGFLFPVGFIAGLLAERGSMSIPIEEMIAGNVPFCYLAIPMALIPAALTRTVIFPGSILSSTGHHAIAGVIGLWFAATLVLGKAWCGYGCFFGGIEEGVASFPAKARIKTLDPRWRYGPWAVLLGVALLSAVLFEPVYCFWICPFKAVSEYPEVRDVESAIQAVIFGVLFLGLVIVLPFLTKKRTQCAFLCPFGAFQSLFEKLSIFQIRINREVCADCALCRNQCPIMAIEEDSVKQGKTLRACMRCGACVDTCRKGAAVWHIRGTPIAVKAGRARLMFLYGAWSFAVMFGGNILANSVYTIERLVGGRFV
jgi:polyferredoxin